MANVDTVLDKAGVTNVKVREYVRFWAEHTAAARVEVVSAEDDARLVREALDAGELLPAGEGLYYSRSYHKDTARSEERTIVATRWETSRVGGGCRSAGPRVVIPGSPSDNHSVTMRVFSYGTDVRRVRMRVGEPSGARGLTMCQATSPGGHLTCANPHCNGHSHVWVHESSAPDRKHDEQAPRRAAARAGRRR